MWTQATISSINSFKILGWKQKNKLTSGDKLLLAPSDFLSGEGGEEFIFFYKADFHKFLKDPLQGLIE